MWPSWPTARASLPARSAPQLLLACCQTLAALVPLPPVQLAHKTGVPEGTSGQICAEILLNPVFQPQLDTAIVSGKKTLQR